MQKPKVRPVIVPTRNALTAVEREQLREFVDRCGILRAAAMLGIHRETMLRALSGQPANNPSLTMIRLRLRAEAGQ